MPDLFEESRGCLILSAILKSNGDLKRPDKGASLRPFFVDFGQK